VAERFFGLILTVFVLIFIFSAVVLDKCLFFGMMGVGATLA